MIRRTSSACFQLTEPKQISPSVAGISVVKTRINVVFPAPFGPSSPYMPGSISSETPFSAVCLSYFFTSWSMIRLSISA